MTGSFPCAFPENHNVSAVPLRGSMATIASHPFAFTAPGVNTVKSSSLSFRPEYLGFAAVIATLPIYEPALHSFHTIAHDTFAAGAPLYTRAALIGALLTAVVWGILCRRLPADSLSSLGYRIPMALGAALGALGLCLLAGPGLPSPASLVLGGAGGVGSALLLVAWGEILRPGPYLTVLVHIAGAGILGAFLLNTVGTLPYPLACALFGILELVALAIPWVARPTSVPVADPLPRPPLSSGSLLAGIALFGLTFRLLGDHTVPYFYLGCLIGAIVAGLAVVPVAFSPRLRRLGASLLSDIVLPLAGCAAVAVSLVTPYSTAARTACAIFYFFAIPLFLAALVARARAMPAHPTSLFASAVGVYVGASLVGALLFSILAPAVCDTLFVLLTLGYAALRAVSPTIAQRLASPHSAAPSPCGAPIAPVTIASIATNHHLTEREAEILRLMAEGATSSVIAEALVISTSTARGHAHKIYQKLGVSTREELLEFLAQSQLRDQG